jgi:predicted Zn-dependent protease with MMP-like domain
VTREDFERHVDAALRTIPRTFRRAMQNIAVFVEDEPSAELLEEVGVEPPGTLLGLYQGIPLPERGWGFGNALPDRITLFQRPIERVAERDGLDRAIWETLVHEVGHYFGMSEAEIEEVETQYWRHARHEP